ncbi:SRPBCC family protein [Aquibium sp. A9E412]|uniref:SRPBCC family protein n=1 Tax=Aquibium sp. A9E412 TaxID=2976767 RepID=UPI0025B09C32|nr:SRPBCC family protein [Aquibium sp. A9E412]MDN2567717.1 SRPBCC family protein [Aquibium sp. A9E412]
MTQDPVPSAGARELVLSRVIPVTRRSAYRCWTEPELMKRWFAPRPWSVSDVEVDVRPGGINRIVMRSPEGEDHPNEGVYLEVVPDRRLVVTDAYVRAWQPSQKPFMTLILELEDADGGTRYTATVRHWSEEDRAAHEAMGFHEGWGQCLDQLVAVARELDEG